MTPRGLTVELGLDHDDLDAGSRFWHGVSGGHLRARAAPWSEVRLGLAYDDPEAAAARARSLGARRAATSPAPGGVHLRSPSGFPFLLRTTDRPVEVGPVVTWSAGHRSRVDQVCLDVAHDQWDRELRFWQELTGWEVARAGTEELARLHTPADLPVRVLLQRRGTGPTSGHLDVATSDRPAEVARLEALGAGRLHEGARWTTLRPPVGPLVCVTDRDPSTGLLPASHHADGS